MKNLSWCEEDDITRFLYQPKASRSERNKGLEGVEFNSLEIVLNTCNPHNILWKDKLTIQEENKVKHLEDMEVSARKVIEEYGIQHKNDSVLNIISFGKTILVKYLSDTKCTTKTEMDSTTSQQILNWLHHSTINESIQDVFLKMMDGGSLAVSVEKPNTLTITINEKAGFLLGANPVALEMRFTINEKEKTNFHSTVKPLKLLEYLCKLTRTPTGGIVLDPFIGSGTTGLACQHTGRNFIGFEISEEYCEIARKRLSQTQLREFGGEGNEIF